jgi:hypothetical protein
MKNSKAEEVIALLSLIAGLLAASNGYHIFSYLLYAKAAFDVFCSIACSLKEIKKGDLD